jgi:hypothetical protein
VRRVLVVAGVLALATAAALVALSFLVASQGQRLLAASSTALGRQITADEVGIHLGLGVGVALRGVRVAADPAVASAEPLVVAERVEMRARLLPLLRRQVVVDRVIVDGPTANVVRDRAGRMNIGTFGPRGGAAVGDGRTGGAPPAPSAPPASRPAFQVAMLRVRGGALHYRDELTHRTSALLDMSADGRQPRIDAPMPVSFRGRLESPDVSLDELAGGGVLDLSANPPSYRGTIEGGSGRLAKIPLDRLSAKVEARPPVLTLEESRVDLLGGHATASAEIGAASKWLVAKVAADGIDLARLPHEESKPYPGGTLALEGQVSGPSPDDRGFKLALAGGGKFGVRDGRVAGLAVGRTIRDLLSVLLDEEGARRLRERYPELFGGDELRFTRLDGSGRLAEGHVRTDDLVVAAPSYEMRGQGSMSLDGVLDVTLRMAASPALTEDLIHDKKVRKFLAGADGRLVVPLRVTGDIHHPRVLPDAAFAGSVAAAALGGTNLEEAASGLLDRLLKPKKRGRH